MADLPPQDDRRRVVTIANAGTGTRVAAVVRRLRLPVLAAIAAVAALSATGCSSSTNLTPDRLQASLGRTFANLYVLQQADYGNPPVRVATLHSQASCQKGGTVDISQEGSGVWLCTITYLPAGPQYPVIAKYNVDVQTDGCYAADGEGPASLNESPTVTGPRFHQLINPLALIDGCFDTT
jgi:ABC-2 type transport system permease protein